ncbi:hypothetical protein C7S16_7037 [Burkholderia thailandensis]|uniref:Uncharacterized protein n=1 Tax=Burkholderia thailandensis TaxID=57975 RepID=A0AAW9CVQ2_BURTH|nr:hypothetical protein [Burkholderia thailandensis]MDW9253098.1 hypothetical protein [Burkholderia thailandensis]
MAATFGGGKAPPGRATEAQRPPASARPAAGHGHAPAPA